MLVKLYGRGATQVHAGKTVYESRNGEIEVPENLAHSLLRSGWSRSPTTAQVDAGTPAVQAPSEQVHTLPPEHPQTESDAERVAREAAKAKADSEQSKAASGTAGGGPQRPTGAAAARSSGNK
jgi:hypothetical protein